MDETIRDDVAGVESEKDIISIPYRHGTRQMRDRNNRDFSQ